MKSPIVQGDFQIVFEQLKSLILPHASQLIIKTDLADQYFLDTSFVRPDGYRISFGGVQINKNYVSYHLMPIYATQVSVSAELKKRMQGKACFNFKKSLDSDQLEELRTLTQDGVATFKSMGWIT